MPENATDQKAKFEGPGAGPSPRPDPQRALTTLTIMDQRFKDEEKIPHWFPQKKTVISLTSHEKLEFGSGVQDVPYSLAHVKHPETGADTGLHWYLKANGVISLEEKRALDAKKNSQVSPVAGQPPAAIPPETREQMLARHQRELSALKPDPNAVAQISTAAGDAKEQLNISEAVNYLVSTGESPEQARAIVDELGAQAVIDKRDKARADAEVEAAAKKKNGGKK